MKLAIMQPYFFPYIGYWQLIAATDTFVLLDDVQYMRHGWIERNRILNPDGGWQYIAVPLEKHSHKEVIRNIAAKDLEWKNRLLSQLTHYRRLTPHYVPVHAAIAAILESVHDRSICRIKAAVLKGVCDLLSLERSILISSECNFDYSQVSDPGDWALRISQQMHADEYINPAGGVDLFDTAQFSAAGIRLSLLRPEPVKYPRNGTFIPWLSIIDVLMFNGIDGTAQMLNQYTLAAA